jgi:hypothetical protein
MEQQNEEMLPDVLRLKEQEVKEQEENLKKSKPTRWKYVVYGMLAVLGFFSVGSVLVPGAIMLTVGMFGLVYELHKMESYDDKKMLLSLEQEELQRNKKYQQLNQYITPGQTPNNTQNQQNNGKGGG